MLWRSASRMQNSLRAGNLRGRIDKDLFQLALFRSPCRYPMDARRQFASETAGKQRISLALYRQLLRWCDDTEDNVPLDYYIPPVYMKPPQIDEQSLRLLAAGDENSRVKASMFPPKSLIDEKHITCPVHTSADARSFLRAVFRLNAATTTNPDDQKQRISLAFEGLKSLSELTQALEELKKNRETHMDRDNVTFRVGQGKLFVRARHRRTCGLVLTSC
jgi:hypothetical protein